MPLSLRNAADVLGEQTLPKEQVHNGKSDPDQRH